MAFRSKQAWVVDGDVKRVEEINPYEDVFLFECSNGCSGKDIAKMWLEFMRGEWIGEYDD